MGKMFDMDNPVWRFMGKVTDMFFLTCLWLLFSLRRRVHCAIAP